MAVIWKTEALFSGRYSRICAESEDGCWQIGESYSRNTRPFYILNSVPDRRHFTSMSGRRGFGYYKTEAGARAAVERYLRQEAA